jgi:hypothetical protein
MQALSLSDTLKQSSIVKKQAGVYIGPTIFFKAMAAYLRETPAELTMAMRSSPVLPMQGDPKGCISYQVCQFFLEVCLCKTHGMLKKIVMVSLLKRRL